MAIRKNYKFLRRSVKVNPYSVLLLRRMDQYLYLLTGRITYWSKVTGLLCHLNATHNNLIVSRATTFFPKWCYMVVTCVTKPTFALWLTKLSCKNKKEG